MKNLSFRLLIFAVLFTFFFVAPSLASSQFGPYELLKNGDIIDLFTPLFLMPLYWSLFRSERKRPVGGREATLFLAFISLWVVGHGMHLAANAIKHLLTDLTAGDAAYLGPALEAHGVNHLKATAFYALTDFLDERLSHFLLHTGMIGLAVMLLVAEFRHHAGQERAALALVLPSGVLHALTLFLIYIEARTVYLGLPFTFLTAAFGFSAGRKWLGRRPVLTFFIAASVLAAVLICGWGLYWGNSACGWFPEFSSECVGWID